METSRIFVKNLPPALTDADFRSHFAGNGRQVTDAKLIRARRIGYVGYRTPQDAAAAVQYFDRSFIRMSKLSVELAKPFTDPSLRPRRKKVPQTAETPVNVPRDKIPPAAVSAESTKKRKRGDVDDSNPKLQEFLETMQPTSRRRKGNELEGGHIEEDQPMAITEAASDDEYEAIPKPSTTITRPRGRQPVPTADKRPPPDTPERLDTHDLPETAGSPEEKRDVNATDDEWLRSRTSRLLDILDPDEDAEQRVEAGAAATHDRAKEPDDQADESVDLPAEEASRTDHYADGALIRETCRLFVRNLSYSTSEEELKEYFETFGALDEVHLPTAGSGANKGYAFVRFTQGSSALEAFQNSDARTLQGRILHVLPAAAKKDSKLDEFAISKLPLRKQNLIRKKAEAASNSFNWNALFMSQDDVNSSTAARLGVSKSDLLDPTSTDAAVKQAIAETTIIQETKSYFVQNGVNLDAFKSRKRGGSSILVKQFGYGTTMEELRKMFEEYGPVIRVLLPPSGTIALVQFAQSGHAQTAFARLAYRRVKGSVMLLEKAPQDLFRDQQAPHPTDRAAGVQALSGAQFLEREDEVETASLFVRNLNFSTTSEQLAGAFRAQKGFVSAQVKTKLDPKKPGQVLSMGFGFVHFRSKEEANATQGVMDGAVLDGHTLTVKASHKGLDAAEERRRADKAKKTAALGSKVVIKNLPFEASKKDVRALLENYGQCRVVRIPKKFGNSSRGFAFAEFTTPQEAANAINALKDTHLLGRRLVIDYAEAEVVDPEEEIAKMQKKVGGQMEKMTLQQLAGRSRKKVTIGDDEPEA